MRGAFRIGGHISVYYLHHWTFVSIVHQLFYFKLLLFHSKSAIFVSLLKYVMAIMKNIKLPYDPPT